jgi:hypothetical protein
VRRSEWPTPHYERTHAIEPAVTPDLFARLVEVLEAISYDDDADYCPAGSAGWWPVDPDLEPHEQKAVSLVQRVARELLVYAEKSYREPHPLGQRRVAPQIVGAEWWLRQGRCSDDHPYHVDKSEVLYEEAGLVRHPYYGSVLYTGNVGGGTHLVNQRLITEQVEGAEPRTDCPPGYTSHPEKIVGYDPPDGECGEGVTVEPSPNRYLLFPGWARHGVRPTEGSEIRRTVLFNWWCWEPPGLNKDLIYLPGEEAHG